MDELEKKMPDNLWRNAFDKAAETPPPRVWDAIERRLDEETGTRILPLWGAGLLSSRPLIWGMGLAAAVSVLLVGWWSVHTQLIDSSTRSVALKPTKSANVVAARPSAGVRPGAQPSPTVQTTTPLAPLAQGPGTLAAAQGPMPSTVIHPGGERLAHQSPELGGQRNEQYQQATLNVLEQTLLTRSGSDAVVSPSSAANRITAASFVPVTRVSELTNTTNRLHLLAGKSIRLRGFGKINRIVWFRPDELPVNPEMPKTKRTSRDVWASASIMPGAFNPMISVQTVSLAGSTSVLDALRNGPSTTVKQASVTSRANFSVAYQASAGIQLTDRWSVESGVGYLAGRSTVETPAQSSTTSFIAVNGLKASAGNLYVDALQNSIHAPNKGVVQASYNNATAGNAYPAVQTNYDSQTRRELTNTYQYVQVPVQLGYQLRPRKKLSLAVLGGLITNIFVKNTVENDVVVTPKDDVYRPVTIEATMGARLRYRPSGQWSASVAGVYQPALGAGTQADSQVQSRPTSAGMSVGVDYHF